ncbi:1,4-alpha-glucan branching protein [Streptomyces sp. NRRL F-4489]|uniref:maltokinase N-terminal cap-like domain-containing protein n=1 Tax=Streptomyces sp. NRRL F-4489 TaxID=1609095 RepID=UPI000746A5C9|nr:1,4-alpha-glucan branching protein [Streptomyces sp. NRRL F-4489]KUL38849.1 1,4-alpha-glucan branching protein [Streptomyces sp. NRRL F-4489]
MAVIHETTLTPTKLELLADWLPGQPWYTGTQASPRLDKAGGFRIDDPEGEVGIEFMVATDRSGAAEVAYLVPLSYRGAPLDGAEQGLIGTTEHGVLGRRWVYDGAHDPVLVGQLLALLQGRAEAQAQNASDTRDESVIAHPGATAGGLGVLSSAVRPPRVVSGPHGTEIHVETGVAEDAAGQSAGGRPARTVAVTLHLARVLAPVTAGDGASSEPVGDRECLATLTAGWQAADGAECRGRFVTLLGPGHTSDG